jgi:hypothetical protein
MNQFPPSPRVSH